MSASVNVSLSFEIKGKSVFASASGLRIGSKGRVTPPGLVFGALPKGDARKLRKLLRAAGHPGKARFPRVASR